MALLVLVTELLRWDENNATTEWLNSCHGTIKVGNYL